MSRRNQVVRRLLRFSNGSSSPLTQDAKVDMNTVRTRLLSSSLTRLTPVVCRSLSLLKTCTTRTKLTWRLSSFRTFFSYSSVPRKD